MTIGCVMSFDLMIILRRLMLPCSSLFDQVLSFTAMEPQL